jgi:hypothetical protein
LRRDRRQDQDEARIETSYVPSAMETTKVPFASDGSFALLDRYPGLVDAFEVTADEQPPIDVDELPAP